MTTLRRRYILLLYTSLVAFIFLIGPTPDTVQYSSIEGPAPVSHSIPSSGESWLSDFSYRRNHTIYGASGAGTNYQVRIDVHSGEGVDAGNLVNLPSDRWESSWPVRFTDDDGVTLLDYWKETSTVDSATYWVEVKDDLDVDVMIYIYYGNSTASSLSNGTATFLFFDDFENGNLDRWDSVGAQWSATSSQKKYGTYSGYYDQLVASDSVATNLTSQQSGIMIHTWYRAETLRGAGIRFFSSIQGQTEAVRAYDYKWQYYDGTDHLNYGTQNSVNAIRWDRCEVGIDLSNYVMKLWMNRTLLGTATHIYNLSGGNLSISETIYRVIVGAQTNYEQWIDDYYVRKWISSEPQHGDWGDGTNWLDDFPYRKKHAINGSAGAGLNYQVQIKIHNGEGTDSGNLVNLPGNRWYPTEAIRFTAKDGVTLLDYWKESYNAENATYWVEITDNLDYDVEFFLYYGNATAPSLSNGTATFVFFDDFEKGNFSNWDSAGADWNVTSTNKKYGSYSAIGNSTGAPAYGLYKDLNITYDCLFHIWYYVESSVTSLTYPFGVLDSDGDNVIMLTDYGFNQLRYLTDANSQWPSYSTYTDGVWFRLELAYNFTASTAYAWNDRQSMGSVVLGDYPAGGSVTSISQLKPATASSSKIIYMDDYYIRKWAQNEPIHAAWEIEEWSNETYKAGGVPWLENWPYRRYHSLQGSQGSGTNYQVEIEIHSGAGTDSGNLVNVPSSQWLPSQPVRFTDNDGVTLLDYWKEYSDEENATYWIEVKDNLDYDTVIYLYYGNTSQSSLSDGDATFLFFDDFESGDLSQWDYAGDQWSATSSEKKYGQYAAHYDGLITGDSMNVKLSSNLSSVMIHSWYRAETLRGGSYSLSTVNSGDVQTIRAHDYRWQYFDGTVYNWYGTENQVSSTKWDRVEVGVNLETYSMDLWVNRTIIGSASHIYNTAGVNVSSSDDFYKLIVGTQTNYEHWMDDIFVRKWNANEPAHGGWIDESPPAIDNPSNVQYDEGDTGFSITWDPTDTYPATYQILKNDTEVKSGLWNTTSETISIFVDGLLYGNHNYTVIVTDAGENSIFDTVYVIVDDGISPIIDDPADINYLEGDTGNSITWDPTDSYPISYEIYRNESLVASGLWNASIETISISVDGLTYDVYNFTLVVADVGGNSAFDTVWVTVGDGTAPTIDTPEDVNYFEGDTGLSITWDPTDSYPVSYEIYRNESLVASGLWNASIETISISVDGRTYGVYNYTLIVTDVGGNTASGIVWVTVSDGTPPDIDNPANVPCEAGDLGNSITWNPTDSYPVSYEIFRNETSIKTGLWNSSLETIAITVDGLMLGVYNYTIIVMDIGGNSIADLVYVIVTDSTPPSITPAVNIEYAEGLTGNTMMWAVSDLYPFAHTILRNGSTMRSGGWDGSDISISVDGLTPGVYNYSLLLTDTSGNTYSSFSYVTVLDIDSPTIDHPSNLAYNEGDIANLIVWDPQDSNPSNFEILQNGTSIKSGAWNDTSETISISVDGLLYGVYNYTIIVTDGVGSTAIDTVIVTVLDDTPPLVDSPDDIYYGDGQTGNNITWYPSDLHPVSFAIYLDDSELVTDSWNITMTNISVSIDGLSLGEYNYTIRLEDIGGNYVTDEVRVFVFDATYPSIPPIGNMESIEGTIGNLLAWNPLDLNPKSYIVYINETVHMSGTWNSSSEVIECSLDTLLWGVYNFTLEVYDLDDNSAVDTVIITVVDGTTPVVNSPEDLSIPEDNDSEIIWDLSDLHLSFYQIFKNGSEIHSANWNGSTWLVTDYIAQESYNTGFMGMSSYPVDLSNLAVGYYNFTMILMDIDGNTVTDIVMVNVFNYEPVSINIPSSITYIEGEIGHSISWIIMGTHNCTYEIHRNGSFISTGTWIVGSGFIVVSVDGLTPGLWNFTLKVNDELNNEDTSTVFVTVNAVQTNPSLSQPSSETYQEGQTGNTISWTLSNMQTATYEIFRNSTLIDSGSWTEGDGEIVASIDDLSPGVWNYTLVVTPEGGTPIHDTVIVTVNPATTTSNDGLTLMIIGSVGGGAIILIIIVGYVLVVKPKRRKERFMGITSTTEKEPPAIGADAIVQVMRGGEFIGNRFRYKLKVLNKTPLVITDISITLISYPRDSLQLDGESSRRITKLDPEGFRTPTFDFLPTQDCVKGDIVASVLYIDSRGRAHSIMSEPFTIRAVCDLMSPEAISPEEYMLKLATFGHGEMTSKVEDWTPEEMHEKTLKILDASNFFEVDSEINHHGEFFESVSKGWAKGIYTGKNLGVEIVISGKSGQKGATCKVRMSGEDEAMIMPAINEISNRLGAWLCPKCGGDIPFELVEDLKVGKSVRCPFCGVTMDR